MLQLDVLHAGDRYTYDIPATTGFLDTIDTREIASTHYGNSYAWTTLRSTLGAHTNVKTMLSGGLVTRSRDGSERAVQLTAPYYAISNERHDSILGAAQDWTHGFSDRVDGSTAPRGPATATSAREPARRSTWGAA